MTELPQQVLDRIEKEAIEAAKNPNILTSEQYDNLIKTHIEKMWGGLGMASIKYFIETGTVNGEFRLRLLSLMQFHLWEVQKQTATAEAVRAMILMEALEKIEALIVLYCENDKTIINVIREALVAYSK